MPSAGLLYPIHCAHDSALDGVMNATGEVTSEHHRSCHESDRVVARRSLIDRRLDDRSSRSVDGHRRRPPVYQVGRRYAR